MLQFSASGQTLTQVRDDPAGGVAVSWDGLAREEQVALIAAAECVPLGTSRRS